ncbi:efflux RND transporter permease subunit [Bradymonas sediminis]|uniref:AcrB/AcrD/AcrF family protein n=1 Tax=Bradymonas sediminis TaxID=1548548 RepID=A0A2Z4FKM8_9DELT|nr:efflux RND transporter permease subunit [Bradymonas sediminis]AWV89254.1 AcrB/AcrD/AcrF family protein [Bradymonas sediminis]TDP73424.1 CzcA family heavy metal efflux pump/hydrophobe/amphiphile efflux-1 (HAE1) family protein [Bradymonas sediminis]
MWISDKAIERPITTIAAMLTLVIFGVVALLVLEVNEFPEVEPPVVSVSIPYPGASPQSVERDLVDPVEDAIAAIEGVAKLRSTSLDGFALLIVEFEFGTDLDRSTQNIRDAISQQRRDLPLEMEEPIITQFDLDMLPIVSLTLSSEKHTVEELSAMADPKITGDLQGITGVAEVQLRGDVEPAMKVDLDPHAMESVGATAAQVIGALRSANLAAPVGRVNSEFEERTIRLQARLEAARNFSEVVVAREGTSVHRLGALATVHAGHEEARSLAYYNDEKAVGIDIIKTTGASTTTVSDAVLARVERLRPTLPSGVELQVVRNSGTDVQDSVRSVQMTLLEGAILTIIVVFLFLNSWRSTAITALALPVSVLASFIAVWAFGFSLNTMSLLGLSLAIGLLIDDAIVVRENIVRHMEMGKDEYIAARDGTAEIGPAVAAITMAIIVVFVPIAFMGGLSAQWLGPMALTIAAAVFVSLFVSFSLDPMLSAYWKDPEIRQGKRKWLGHKIERFNAWLDGQTKGYQRLVGWALGHRLIIVIITAVSFGAALALPATGMVGVSFFPTLNTSNFTISILTPAGSSLEYTRLKVLEAAKIARHQESVEYTYTTIGGEGDTVDEATIFVKLAPKSERSITQSEVAKRTRDAIDHLVGVDASISSGGPGGPGKELQIQLIGPDIEELNRIAEQAKERVSTVAGAVDVSLSTRGRRPEYQVDIDRDLAATLGLSVGQVAEALRPAFAGVDAGDWVDAGGQTRNVRVRYAPQFRANEGDLSAMPLLVAGAPGEAARIISLGEVARTRQFDGPGRIEHLDRDRIVTVEANTQDRPMSAVVQDIEAKMAEIDFPEGYSYQQGGNVEDQRDVFRRMLIALAVGVLMMYLLLVVQFSSFVEPLPILISLPLSLIGVMVALVLTGTTLNLMSMIGVVLLMGIVAKNAILLVDFAKWSQKEGMDIEESIIEAGGVRLRPILMTSVAIIAGMLPVAIGGGEGGEFRAPLGIAVIGGVITSTILTLLVIPTFYDIVVRTRMWLASRLGKGEDDIEAPGDIADEGSH